MLRDFTDTQNFCYDADASVFSEAFESKRECVSMGRPKVTDEQKLEKRRAADRARSAAKALAEGRTPGHTGRPAKHRTEDEMRELRRIKSAKWRSENREKSREITRESERRRAAAKALAEGRVPGKRGAKKRFTADEQRAKRKAKTERWNELNRETMREKARVREQAKRDGTFVSKALPRLTDEERRIVNVVMAANRRARVRNNGGRFTKDDVIAMTVAQDGMCLLCCEPLGDGQLHVDHWTPLIRGGSNGPDNLALLHEKCNLAKAAQLPSEFGLPNDLVAALGVPQLELSP